MSDYEEEKIRSLREVANTIRRHDLAMIYHAGIGHLGGDFSSIDILVTLYFAVLHIDHKRPNMPERDRFVLSKGHAVGALYATLANAGFFSLHELESFARPLSAFSGHPNRLKVPGVEANTGPLGHGLPIAVGMALGARLGRQAWHTYVLTGDGELQEGSNWEAAMAAAHYRLDNLTLIIDRNGLQQGDTTERTMQLEPLAEKWRAFGWRVREIDGHDYRELLEAFHDSQQASGQPHCLIAHTHKGQGISFMRDRAEWHHRVPGEEEFRRALQELSEVRL
jgi:transketolase